MCTLRMLVSSKCRNIPAFTFGYKKWPKKYWVGNSKVDGVVSKNVTVLMVNIFQQFIHIIYVPFIFWMIINNSCSTILIIYPTIFDNYSRFVWEHHVAGYLKSDLNKEAADLETSWCQLLSIISVCNFQSMKIGEIE